MTKLRVHETSKRSALKTLSSRLLEITIDTMLLLFFVELHEAIGLAITIELICLTLHYFLERIWARSNFGRHVHRNKKCEVCANECKR